MVNCFGVCDGGATVATAGGIPPFVYSWNTVPSQSGSSATGLCAGSYIVKVTGADGCSDTTIVNIIQPTQLDLAIESLNHISCYGDSTGSAVVSSTGGAGSYAYSWNTIPAQAVGATGLMSGIYIVKVSDLNGCTDSVQVSLTQPASALQAFVSKTDVSCFGGNNGSVSVIGSGGTSNYSYSWNTNPVQTTPTASDLFAGTYSVRVTDSKGCVFNTSPVVISEPSAALLVQTTDSDIDCFGTNTGTAEATVSGGTTPYTYSWNTTPVQNSSLASNLYAGTYSVNVTDAKGCTTISSAIEISQPANGLQLDVTSVNVNCYGANTGSASATVAGGTLPYTYSWSTSPSQSTPLANFLAAGTYSVLVRDSKGMSMKNDLVIIEQPSAPLSAGVTNTNVSCFGNSSASATATATGGSPAYTYSWSTSAVQNSPTATGLAAGTYSVSISDSKGCTLNPLAISITQPSSALMVSTADTDINCFGNNLGRIELPQ